MSNTELITAMVGKTLEAELARVHTKIATIHGFLDQIQEERSTATPVQVITQTKIEMRPTVIYEGTQKLDSRYDFFYEVEKSGLRRADMLLRKRPALNHSVQIDEPTQNPGNPTSSTTQDATNSMGERRPNWDVAVNDYDMDAGNNLNGRTSEDFKIPSFFENEKDYEVKITNQREIQLLIAAAKIVYSTECPEYFNLLVPFLESLPKLSSEQLKERKSDFEMEIKKISTDARKEAVAEYNQEHLTIICKTALSLAIEDPKVLNKHYKAFSEETYGEINFCFLDKLLRACGVERKPEEEGDKPKKEEDKPVFVDLGSGLGQAVTYAAGQQFFSKAIGIEKSAVPAKYAETQKVYFLKLMAFFGKEHCDVVLHNEDMLKDEMKRLVSENATIIFMNNVAFPADLRRKIVFEIIQNCKDGIRILSSRSMSEKKRDGGRYRYLEDFEAMSKSETVEGMENGVSWTAKPIDFFKTTISQKKYQLRVFEEIERVKKAEEEQKKKREAAKARKDSKALTGPAQKKPRFA